MALVDTIQVPVQGQPISSSLYGIPVRNAIANLDVRTATLEANTQKLVKRGRRTTAKGPITTESSYLRVDDIPVIAGGGYRIMTSNINLDSSVGSDTLIARIRMAFSAATGTVATTSSTQIGAMRCTMDTIIHSNLIPISTFYFPSASGFISLLVTGTRETGSGTFQFFASTAEPFDLTIEFAGADPGDTAVIL
jgi:hypothetical protein